jgi:hypothetical protein
VFAVCPESLYGAAADCAAAVVEHCEVAGAVLDLRTTFGAITRDEFLERGVQKYGQLGVVRGPFLDDARERTCVPGYVGHV